VLLALGAGFWYAVYAVIGEDLLGRPAPLAVAPLTLGVAALVLAPALAGEPVAGGPAAWRSWPTSAWSRPRSRTSWYLVGMRTTPVTVSGVLALVEPLRRGAPGSLLLPGAVAILTIRKA
jgi:hypothetical protein